MPGSWADRAAGCAWEWDGFGEDGKETGAGLRPGLGSVPPGSGETAGVCGASGWDQQREAPLASHPCPAGDTGVQVMLRQVL